jgi:hypothetical protein
VTAVEVERSLRRGIQYLIRGQHDDGSWDEYPTYECGLSSLCTLALVTAGEDVDSPAVRSALTYLRGCQPNDTYSVALQTLAFCQVGAAEDLTRIRRNVRWLETEQVRPGQQNRFPGAWGYGSSQTRRTSGDPSNTQFALLALSAAEESGVNVSKEIFARSLEYWQRRQNPDGGWAYGQDLVSTGSMTCAGIASTIICRGRLSDSASRVEGNTIRCCGADDSDDAIDRGLAWLGRYFSVKSNPTASTLGSSSHKYYYLYALERVGRYTGRRLIGAHDWYREGADELVGLQEPTSGYWHAPGSVGSTRYTDTAFALLFLAKGKRQVALGRLDYGDEPSDSQHPDAARQLVRHVQRAWGRDLTWQTVRLEGSTVAEMLQAPVLLISGNQPLDFTAGEKTRLQQYVEQGGFLAFEAVAGDGCGPAAPFEESVADLCRELFDSPLEPLPPSHPLWYAERRVDPAALGENFMLYGVQTCCRTGVAYWPRSLTCRWELNDLTRRVEYPAAVEAELDAAVAVGQNVIAYATGRELKEKLEARSVLVRETPQRAGQRGVIGLARLGIDAGGEQAARAIPNLTRYVDRELPIRVTTDVPLVPPRADRLAQFPIVWFHGRRAFELSEDQVVELRTYLEQGGTLLIDAICGDEAFTRSVREEMARVLPRSPLEPLPADHPLMTTALYGYDLSRVTLRMPQRGASGAITVRKRQTTPVLEMAQLEGRAAVIFSPYDLSCALESQSSIQCPGYPTEDAAKIGINMLLYVLLE